MCPSHGCLPLTIRYILRLNFPFPTDTQPAFRLSLPGVWRRQRRSPLRRISAYTPVPTYHPRQSALEWAEASHSFWIPIRRRFFELHLYRLAQVAPVLSTDQECLVPLSYFYLIALSVSPDLFHRPISLEWKWGRFCGDLLHF